MPSLETVSPHLTQQSLPFVGEVFGAGEDADDELATGVSIATRKSCWAFRRALKQQETEDSLSEYRLELSLPAHRHREAS